MCVHVSFKNLWSKKNEAISINLFNFYLFPPLFPSKLTNIQPTLRVIFMYFAVWTLPVFLSIFPRFPDTLNDLSKYFASNVCRWATSKSLRNQIIYAPCLQNSCTLESINMSHAPFFSETLLHRWAVHSSASSVSSLIGSVLSTYKIKFLSF